MYVLYNEVNMPFISTRNADPQEKAKFALLKSGNGLGYMDLDMIEYDMTARPPLIPICSSTVGCNNQIVYSEVNQKLVFLRGVNRGLEIIPLLHQNLIHLQDARPRDHYLYGVQTRDIFQALGKDNKVHIWCM